METTGHTGQLWLEESKGKTSRIITFGIGRVRKCGKLSILSQRLWGVILLPRCAEASADRAEGAGCE